MTTPSVVTCASAPVAPCSSEIDLELLTFIERYPSACDNAGGIAQHVGRNTHSVQKELDDLALLGVLRMHANGKGIEYRLTRALTMRRAIVRLARYFDQPRTSRN